MMKVALHEAGHARIAIHFGFDAETWIETDPATGRAGVARTSIPEASPETAESDAYVRDLSEGERARLLDLYLLRAATIAMAGPEAEREIAPDSTTSEIDLTSGADHDLAARLLWDRSDSPRRLQANLAQARGDARGLVRRYAPEIVAIAVELMKRGKISRERMREIVAANVTEGNHVMDQV